MASNKTNSRRPTPEIWSQHHDHVLRTAGLPDPKQTLVERSYGPNHLITFGVNLNRQLAYSRGTAPDVKIAKDIRIATTMITAQVGVKPEALADPTGALKSVLRT